MRENLFRGFYECEKGKQKAFYNGEWHNGEWVEGNYIHDNITGKSYILPFGNINESDKVNQEGCLYCVSFEVIPETVGQFTGLLDRNEKKIFEGDIVTDRYANGYTPIFKNGIYMAYNPKDIKLKKAEPSTQFNIIWKDGCEIIGKIHDNPELLKEE